MVESSNNPVSHSLGGLEPMKVKTGTVRWGRRSRGNGLHENSSSLKPCHARCMWLGIREASAIIHIDCGSANQRFKHHTTPKHFAQRTAWNCLMALGNQKAAIIHSRWTMESRNFLTRTLGQTQEENGNSGLPLPNRQDIRGELAAKRWWLNLTNKSISKMAHSASRTPERSHNSCLDYVQLQNLWLHEKSCNLLNNMNESQSIGVGIWCYTMST